MIDDFYYFFVAMIEQFTFQVARLQVFLLVILISLYWRDPLVQLVSGIIYLAALLPTYTAGVTSIIVNRSTKI